MNKFIVPIVLFGLILLAVMYDFIPKGQTKKEPKLVGVSTDQFTAITDTAKINELEEAYKYVIEVEPPTEAEIKKYGKKGAWDFVEERGRKERDAKFKKAGIEIPEKYK